MTIESMRANLLRRGVLGAAILAAAAVTAIAATVGGGFWPALGPCRITVKKAGIAPVDITANLRFQFDGDAEDESGTGTILVFDEAGQSVVDQFPALWTGRKSGAFKVDILNDDFTDFLEGVLADATGQPASVTLDSAGGSGKVNKSREDLRVALSAAGEVVLGEGPARRLKVRMRLK